VQLNALNVARFWSKVDVGCEDACWEWSGYRDALGYGQVKIDGQSRKSHRIAVVAMGVSIASEDVIMHTCDNPSCCNPKHLVVGTHAANVADRVAKRRSARGARNGRSLLTEEQVREIKKDDRRLVDVAKDYGVSPSTISLIRRGKNWAHI
jgi:hypothetical protein